jgi:DNA-binding Lrp family transcriptional regulator
LQIPFLRKINNRIIHIHTFSGGSGLGRGPETRNKKLRLLLEYLKDSNRSDRQLARELGVSQATVSRLKNKMLKEGLILHFSAIPDLGKMGYEIMAFSFVKFKLDHVTEIQDMAKRWAESHPEILFTSRAQGMGADAVTISVHKNYAAYKNFLAQNRECWGDLMENVNFILVDLHGEFTKPLSFKSLAEDNGK